MESKTFETLREAIHHTATRGGRTMKELAAELDWSPSELSMRTTLGEENARSFPADKLIALQELTEDHSILKTMADRLGFEIMPKADRYPSLVMHLTEEAKRLNASIQAILSTPWVQAHAEKGKH